MFTHKWMMMSIMTSSVLVFYVPGLRPSALYVLNWFFNSFPSDLFLLMILFFLKFKKSIVLLWLCSKNLIWFLSIQLLIFGEKTIFVFYTFFLIGNVPIIFEKLISFLSVCLRLVWILEHASLDWEQVQQVLSIAQHFCACKQALF